ncbi:uncharacterized protein LOC134828841 [Culicoides brevitarsis]|uniref:uncharacterized protein LOC134828841 n=1 Tax=Culicoides brevitarsis TaxID=469753 RepID=UPI00307B509B
MVDRFVASSTVAFWRVYDCDAVKMVFDAEMIFLLIGCLAFQVNPAPQANLVPLSSSVPPNFPPSPQSGGSGPAPSYPTIPVINGSPPVIPPVPSNAPGVSPSASVSYPSAPQVSVPVSSAPVQLPPVSLPPVNLPPVNSVSDQNYGPSPPQNARPIASRPVIQRPVQTVAPTHHGQPHPQHHQQHQQQHHQPQPHEIKTYKRIEEKGQFYSYSYFETPDQIREQNTTLVQCKDPAASPCNYEVGYYQYRSPEGQVVRVDYVSSEDGHVDKITINPE